MESLSSAPSPDYEHLYQRILCCLGNFLAWALVLRISDRSKYFTCNGLKWRIMSENKSQSILVTAPKIKRVAEAGYEAAAEV